MIVLNSSSVRREVVCVSDCNAGALDTHDGRPLGKAAGVCGGYRRTEVRRIAVVIAMIECFGDAFQRPGSAKLVDKQSGVHPSNSVADRSHHVN